MRFLAVLVLLAGCGAEEERAQANVAQNNVAAPPAAPPAPEDVALSRAAADALRLYYDRLGRREWRAAFAMRAPAPGLTFARFVANYERYRDYRATVAMPSLPGRRDGAVWVQVPVQLYGRMRDGTPFGSVGVMMLKREAGEERWKIQS